MVVKEPTYKKGMNFYFKKPLYERALLAVKEGRFARGFSDWLEGNVYIYPIGAYHTLINPKFALDGKTYNYHTHKNSGVVDERSIEMPLAWDFIDKYAAKDDANGILEIGNVINVHSKNKMNHTIVDKYEVDEGILNVDIVDFKPARKYDMIISLSTIEHVGFDEAPQDPKKVAAAMDNIVSLLNERGHLLITMPIGYNPAVDEYVKTTKLKKYFMVKSSIFNNWKEATEDEAYKRPYNSRYKRDNAIVILRENVSLT